MRNELPPGWAASRLGSAVELRYGKGLPERIRRPGMVPVYGSNGIVGAHDEAFTEGATIIVGRKGSVGEVHFSAEPCWPIDTTYFVQAFGPFEPHFLTYLLKNLELAKYESSTAIPGLSRDDAHECEIPVPPILEQRRIVEKVEALFDQVNAAKGRLARVPVILKRFREAVLVAACSGKLTQEWREAHNDVPSRELSSLLTLRVPEEATSPTEDFELDIPREWPIVSADRIATLITSGSRGWTRYYHNDGRATFVMAQNVRPLHFDQSHRRALALRRDEPEKERTRVARDDLLVTIVGANTGDVCRVPVDVEEHYVCQSVALIRPALRSLSSFLELWLNSPAHGRRQYLTWAYGEGRPHLSFDHLRSTAIALPSLAEQMEILGRVQALFTVADAIERRLGDARARTERLPQAILATAFRGELVPTEAELARAEGRDYESAEELLRRIATARAEAKPSRKQRGKARAR